MLYFFLVILLTLTSIALIGVVLIQSGKGDGLSGAFGMGEGQAVFGSRAGDVLTKTTTWFAVAFMLLSLATTYVSKHASDSMLPGTRSTYSPQGRSEKPTTLADYEKALASTSGVHRSKEEDVDGGTTAPPVSAKSALATNAAGHVTTAPEPATAPVPPANK